MPGVPSGERENWRGELRLFVNEIAVREQHNLWNTVFCVSINLWKESCLDGHLTERDVKRFRNGSVHKSLS